MALNLNDIGNLARSIGPRPPGSVPERRAALYVEERLQRAGIPAIMLPFRTPRSYVPIYVSLFFTTAISVPIALISPIVGLLLGVVGLVLTALELTGQPTISRVIATSKSQNVVGLIPGRLTGSDEDELVRRVILSAHLDSPKAGTIWREPLIDWFRPMVITVFASVVAIPILLILYALTASTIIWALALIPALVLLAAIGLLIDLEFRGRPTAGANNNASGIAAVLAVARELVRQRPEHLEVWTVFTGAKEAGMAGMIHFLNENQFDPQATYFINIDNVGAGAIRFTTAEGFLIPVGCSPALTHLAGHLAIRNPEWEMQSLTHALLPTDGFITSMRGYQSISIMAYDHQGRPANWHQVTDTLNGIDPTTIQTAADVTLGIIRRLDQELIDRARASQEVSSSPIEE